MPANEVTTELPFPFGGINLTTEFQNAPPETTPIAENVRGIDIGTYRQRGASRTGLARYIPERIPDGNTVIQHLAVIVDPAAEGRRVNFLVADPDWIEDPLNPGFYVPPGGWANQQGAELPSDGVITFVQKQGINGLGSVAAGSHSMSWGSAPSNHDLMVVAVTTVSATSNVQVSVTSGAATLSDYERVGQGTADDGYARVTSGGLEYSISLWYRVATADANEITVNVSHTATAFKKFAGAVFRGTNQSAPFVDGDIGTESSAVSALTTPTIDIGGTGRLIVGFFALTASGTLDYTIEPTVEGLYQWMHLGSPTDTLSGTPPLSGAYRIGPTPTQDAILAARDSGSSAYVTVAASFKA